MTAWFSADNWADVSDVTFTASDEVATLPAENVAKRQVERVWRVDSLSTGSTSATLDIDLQTTREIGVIGVITPRDNDQHADLGLPVLGQNDTVRHELSAVSAGANELHDSGAIASDILKGHGYHVYFISPAVNARYYRLTVDAISRDTAPDNYFDIGRIWLGPRFDFGISYSAPQGYAWASDSRVTRSLKSVAEYTDRRDPYRFLSTVFKRITVAERTALIDFERKTTNVSQFLFGLNQTSPNRDAILCRNDSRGLEHANFQNYRREFALTESL